jgi:hypothetical protein
MPDMTLTETDAPSHPLRSITFQLTLQDMQMLAARPEPLPRRANLAIGGAWIVGCLIIGLRDEEIAALMPWAGEMRMYIAVGAVTIAYYAMKMVARQALTNARVKRARAPSTTTTIDIWPDRFDVSQDGVTSSCAWDQLADIGLEDNGLTLYTIPGEMLHIPQRAFSDRQAMLDFNLQIDDILREIDDHD